MQKNSIDLNETRIEKIMQKMKDYEGKYLDITGKIINAAMEVHKVLGAGYQEVIYHKAMIIALAERGLSCESERVFNKFSVSYTHLTLPTIYSV